jgi:hypothetical protein
VRPSVCTCRVNATVDDKQRAALARAPSLAVVQCNHATLPDASEFSILDPRALFFVEDQIRPFTVRIVFNKHTYGEL